MTLATLLNEFDHAAVELLQQRLEEGIAIELDPILFATEVGDDADPVAIAAMLEKASALGLVQGRTVHVCPIPSCGRQLDDDDVGRGQCPNCETNYRETSEQPLAKRVFRIEGGQTRDISWMIVIHGFNTTGPWQEEFGWRIATKFKFSAPVFIYKYGLIRFSVLVKWRHRALVRALGKRVADAISWASNAGFKNPPDVVIHSFGSHLFGQLLQSKDFRDLRFGRVIATGAIIDPHFDWSSMIESQRIEAILNHCGGSDLPVRLAQFFIPGTGPGGRAGFSDRSALNLVSPGFGHSSCFEQANLTANLMDGGPWDRFLRGPEGSFADSRLRKGTEVGWSPVWRFVTFGFRLVFMAVLALAALVFLAAFGVGLLKVASIAVAV